MIKRIAIVGGGIARTVLGITLLKTLGCDVRVTIFEKETRPPKNDVPSTVGMTFQQVMNAIGTDLTKLLNEQACSCQTLHFAHCDTNTLLHLAGFAVYQVQPSKIKILLKRKKPK